MCCREKKKNKKDRQLKVKGQNPQKNNQQSENIKVVILGDYGVGKTSIASRYINLLFDDNHQVTLGGQYMQAEIQCKEQIYKLHLWDTAGSETFNSMLSLYYRDAQVAFIVYDITSSKSFQKVRYWMKELNEKILAEELIIIIIGNKLDLEEFRQVPIHQAFQYAQSLSAEFFETSAKTGEGIQELFKQLGEVIYLKYQQKQK